MIKDTPNDLKYKLDLASFEVYLPVSFLPKPTENDYRIGFIERYIVSKVNMTQITEVSKDSYSFVTSALFKKVKFKWRITGTLTSKYEGRTLLQEGVIDFNRKQVNDINKEIPGIKDIFNNYTQFYKPS